MNKTVAGITLLACLLLVPGAVAHAVPSESEPVAGARLDASPSHIRVVFTEPVYRDGSFIQVWDASNDRVDAGDLLIEGDARPVMTVSVPELEDGAYRIVWQTYSKTDGHTVGGSIGFAIGGFDAPATATVGEEALEPLAVLGRLLVYLGLAGAIGALAFHSIIGGAELRGRDERALERMLLASPLIAMVGLVLLIVDTAAQTGTTLSVFLGNPGGQGFLRRTILAAAIAGLTLLWSARGMTPVHRRILLLAWIAFAALGATMGHAGIRGSWAFGIQTLHAVAMAAWVGGLGVFAITLRSADVETGWTHGRRFGTLFLWSVLLVAASGILLSVAILWGRLGSPGDWINSRWGMLLVAKVLLVLVMVAVAGINRYVLLASGGKGARLRRMFASRGWRPLVEGGAVRDLRRLVRVEAAVGVTVILLAAGLMTVAAPQPSIEPGLTKIIQGDHFVGTLTLRPEPVAGGFHAVILRLEDGNGQTIAGNTCGRDDCIRLRWWSDADGEQGAQQAAAVPEGRSWRVQDVLLPTAGNYTFQVVAQTADVFRDTLETRIDVDGSG